MKKKRIQQECKVCSSVFEIRPCEFGHIATCSKECSLKYRSINSKGRVMDWSEKIWATRRGKEVSRKHITVEYREKCRSAAIRNGLGIKNRGKKLSPEHIAKISSALLGHKRGGWKLSADACARMSERFKGDRSTFWRGGVTSMNAIERSSARYKAWRASVFKRDNFTCQSCGARGVALNADHIKPFAIYIELRYEIGNGRTLCIPCHKATDTYAGKMRRLLKTVHGIDVFETK